MNLLTKWWADQSRAELWDLLRMWPTLIVAAITVWVVHLLAPQQVGILVYTIAKLSLAGYLGYWLDRWVFPDARPGERKHMQSMSAHTQVAAMASLESAPLSKADRESAVTTTSDAMARMDWLVAVAQLRRAAVIIGALIAAGLMT